MIGNDLRYACRLMRRSPAFTAVAVLSLALGIGANTAIFSLFDAILLRHLPVERPEELAEFLRQYPGEARGWGYWGWSNFELFRDHNHVFAAITGCSFDNLAPVRLEGGAEENVVMENVLGNYFSVLGLKPALGRLLGEADIPPAGGEGEVAVVSYRWWETRMQRDPSAIGKRIFEHGAPKTIVGVAPRDYIGPRLGVRTDVWIPVGRDQYSLIARLKPGVTLPQARAEVRQIYALTLPQRARSKDPLARQVIVDLESAAHGFVNVSDQYGKPLQLLMVVVGLLLLLACLNLASMLLARAAAREREMAVRVGLGAGRGRLVRQMLTESLLLSTAGALVGALFAWFGARALVGIVASGRPFERIVLEVSPDLRVLGFTAAIAIATGVLFGLAPAWHAFRAAPASPLRQVGRGSQTPFWRWFGKTLVSAEVALSVVLAVAAGLFLTHLARLRHFDLGIRPEHVLQMRLDPSRSGYRPEQLVQPYEELLARLAAMPGVRSASISGCTPIQGCGFNRYVSAEGVVERPEERRLTAISFVSPRYFETLGIPLSFGRDFSLADAGRPRVAIVSASLARYYFPGTTALGKRLSIDPDARAGPWPGGDAPYEIVGVVGDVKPGELREPPRRTVYFNMFQESRLADQFEVRTVGDPESLAQAARRTVAEVLKTVPIDRLTTLEAQVDGAIVPERLVATLSAWFGGLGAVLAGIGLYGLLGYTVARRTNEIGVRMALGATSGGIVRMVLADAFGMVLAGVACGGVLAMAGRPLAARLFADLRIAIPEPLMAGAAGILAIALLAASIPARRASRVDPVEALREE